MVKLMKKEDSTDFDSWWQEKKNRYKLMEIYHTTDDPNIAVMEIAEAAWEECLKCQSKKRD